ncbi:uncharacterized protein BDZ99DRAFT_518817 [Mytilinidion resinicola]|uniref:Uncharacterized protein n=1 Tax=Mytilinidion resinicola TaxID=574789 RepID=A0A6A6YUE3_9PEZI|nr:uncharacterized protein BDZ99DRAFT_518817 [Mytilinidion resinicola]KAF2811557.1 hypothetical protein BDZ99DRAFT_518817 [Mytilinidion resinicola]
MASNAAFSAHQQKDEACKKRAQPYDDRISPGAWELLDFKKATFALLSDVQDKWANMCQVLFPQDEEIPSPFDDHHINARWERLLPQFLHEELTKELDPVLAPIITRIKERISITVQMCKEQVHPQPEEQKTTPYFFGSNSNRRESVKNRTTSAIRMDNNAETLHPHQMLYEHRVPSSSEEASNAPDRPNRITLQSSDNSIRSLNR